MTWSREGTTPKTQPPGDAPAARDFNELSLRSTSVRNSNMAAVPIRGFGAALRPSSTFTLVLKIGFCLSPYEVNPTNRWTQSSPGSNWSRHNLTKLKWREMLTKLVHKGSSNKHLDKLKKAILWKPSLTLWSYDLARRGGNELYSHRLKKH